MKPNLIGIDGFKLGSQKLSKVVAALISVGIVTAMEYQKFHLRMTSTLESIL